ncbi:MAG: sortase [Massiliimalia sp.]|jgi:sortase A
MKDKRQKVGGGFIAVGILMLVAAVALYGYNLYDEYRAGKSANSVLEELQQQIPALKTTEGTSAQEVYLPDDSQLPDYSANPEMEMPEKKVAEDYYIGVLEIYSLGISLPVISEWDDDALQIAPCRYSGSAYTGNLVIAAHNYQTHFGRIKTLLSGDQVIFTDVKGHSFLYEVTAVETIQSTDVEEVLSEEWDLTLFTCTLDGLERVVVHCLKS